LPTEIRLMIWKLARPDARVIKMSKSNIPGKPAPFNYFCWLEHPDRHLVSRVPVPNLLHACAESREVALTWFRLLFVPICKCGGTYFDTERDYIYYGLKERKILVDSSHGDFNAYDFGDGNLWIKDRQSIPNIVIHYTRPSGAGNIIFVLLTLSRWCNKSAHNVLLLGPLNIELKACTLVSDLVRSVVSFDRENPEKKKQLREMIKHAKIFRDCPYIRFWRNFNPTMMVCAALCSSPNVQQKYGFIKKLYWNHRVRLAFNSTTST